MAVSRYRVEESPCWVPRSDTTDCRRETSTRHQDHRVQTKPCGHAPGGAYTAIYPLYRTSKGAHASYSAKQHKRTQHTARSYMAVTRYWVKESPCWVPRSDTTDCRRETSTQHRDGQAQTKPCLLYKHGHVPDRVFTAIGLVPKHDLALCTAKMGSLPSANRPKISWRKSKHTRRATKSETSVSPKHYPPNANRGLHRQCRLSNGPGG